MATADRPTSVRDVAHRGRRHDATSTPCVLLLAAKREAVLPPGAVIRIPREARGILAFRARDARATICIALAIRQRKSGQIDRGRRRLDVARHGSRGLRGGRRRNGSPDRRCCAPANGECKHDRARSVSRVDSLQHDGFHVRRCHDERGPPCFGSGLLSRACWISMATLNWAESGNRPGTVMDSRVNTGQGARPIRVCERDAQMAREILQRQTRA